MMMYAAHGALIRRSQQKPVRGVMNGSECRPVRTRAHQRLSMPMLSPGAVGPAVSA